jgi:xanthine dehydrogenase small subunit
MISFILNDKLLQTNEPPGMLLLDLIRYREHLTGTKIGCREGDCGACTVLLGEFTGNKLIYRQVTSCLTPLGNAHLKHVVTVEGLNGVGLNFLQQSICEEGGTQCGFCTPGFIVSMAGFCLSDKAPTHAHALAAVDGNICRCTGYKSIERALSRITALLKNRQAGASVEGNAEDAQNDPVDFAIANNILPPWFADIPRRLTILSLQPNGVLQQRNGGRFLGGGTDCYVQQHADLVHADIEFLAGRAEFKGVIRRGDKCLIGAAATISDLNDAPLIRQFFPHFDQYAHLIASTPIRNIATVAGNIVNASPIGDLSIFFLALDATLTLHNGATRRELPLRKFYKGYKQLAKSPDECIESISFDLPIENSLFHFEKVSKRTCLDIASVNTALQLQLSGDRITKAHLSAGGVNAIPAYLERSSSLMAGRRPEPGLVREVIAMALTETAPISDVRGTAEYKRLLLGQLIKAHFLTLFPNWPVEELV